MEQEAFRIVAFCKKLFAKSSLQKRFNKTQAKLWGDKLQHLQKKCFEERNAASCQLVHKEMSGASELFNNLSNVTQMTASQAKRRL